MKQVAQRPPHTIEPVVAEIPPQIEAVYAPSPPIEPVVVQRPPYPVEPVVAEIPPQIQAVFAPSPPIEAVVLQRPRRS